MAAANAHLLRDARPAGRRRRLHHAPEISQMFGELVGVWLADLWRAAAQGAAAGVRPLCRTRPWPRHAGERRAARAAWSRLQPSVHLVETSPMLRAAQAEALPGVRWHDSVDTCRTRARLLIVANEFFDALPIRQHVRTRPAGASGWWTRRRNGFAPVPGRDDTGDEVPPRCATAPLAAYSKTRPPR
jgi:hypothetical protein